MASEQTTTPENRDDHRDEPGADRADPVAGAGTLDVGPEVTLGTISLLLGIALAAGAAGLVGWLVAEAFSPGAGGSVWKAPPAILAVFAVGMAVLRPWRKRRVGRWPFAWLAHSGVCFALTLAAAAGLLYSAPSDQRLALGLTLAAAHFAALLAEAALIGRRLQGRGG